MDFFRKNWNIFQFKSEIKKSSFLKNLFFGSFYFGSRVLIIKTFLTPRVSENLTTVKFSEPVIC